MLGYTSNTTELCVQTVGRMLAILQFGEERCSREVIRHALKLLKPILGLSFAMTRGLSAAVSRATNVCILLHWTPCAVTQLLVCLIVDQPLCCGLFVGLHICVGLISKWVQRHDG